MKKFNSIKDFFKKYNVGILITGDQSIANDVALRTADFAGIEMMMDNVSYDVCICMGVYVCMCVLLWW